VTNGNGPAIAPLAAAEARAAATNALEAILFREVLAPLTAGLGPVGQTALGAVADALFARPKT